MANPRRDQRTHHREELDVPVLEGSLAPLERFRQAGTTQKRAIAVVEARDLPDRLEGYEQIDLVALAETSSLDLDGPRRRTLDAWVRRGGRLLLLPGADPAWFEERLIRSFLPADARRTLQTRSATGAERARQYPVSALTGEGIDQLLEAIGDFLTRASEAREVSVPLSDGATIAWLYRHGEVRSRRDDGDMALLTVALVTAASAQFERRLAR